jgi:sugar lactone lactonase YvrE
VSHPLISMNAELVLDARNAIGESPVWRAAEQALYWVDIPERRLHRWQAACNKVEHWSAPEMIGCIAPGARARVIEGQPDPSTARSR